MDHGLILVFLTYLIGTASPGPSNMMIMGVAMQQGRSAAIILALGVICGSLFWALMAATGISAILATFAEAMMVIKVAGGLYLLYLAVKAARSAMSTSARHLPDIARQSTAGLFLRGMLMHLTNPKAVLTWIAVMSLGLQPGSPSSQLIFIIVGCALAGICVFTGYAILFSTRPMVALYQRARRWIEGSMAFLFAGAGITLLWKHQ